MSVEGMTERGYDDWPAGLFPVSVTSQDNDGNFVASHKFTLDPTPSDAVFYATRDPLINDALMLLEKQGSKSKFTALLPSGEYVASFFKKNGDATVTRHFEVPDPTPIVETEHKRLGTFAYRDHRWDRYILIENAYSSLSMGPGDRVLDLGGHIGTFTRTAVLADVDIVHTYEPERDNFALLERNCGHHDNVVLHKAVVVNDQDEALYCGYATLWIDAAVGGDFTRTALHSLHRTRGARVPVRVDATSLINVLDELRPTVVKIDVEGAELRYNWDVFLDQTQLNAISVEFEKRGGLFEDSNAHFHEVMKSLGLECIRRGVGWAVVETWVRK